MAQKVKHSKTLLVKEDAFTSFSGGEISWSVGQIVDRGRVLVPGEDFESIVYTTVDKDGNILNKQEATLCVRSKRSSKKPSGN